MDLSNTSLIWVAFAIQFLIYIAPGIVAFVTSRAGGRTELTLVREVRTSAFDMTPGERAYVEHEERERARHGRKAA